MNVSIGHAEVKQMRDIGRVMQSGVLLFSALFAALLLLPGRAAAENNPLLPRPMKAQYGAGRLMVRTLSIRLKSTAPAKEDRFIATELSRRIRERTGIQLALSGGEGPAIVLERTGALDPLATPGEQPGPEGRESYDLKVSPKGVEIHGRSSAAVFYGVETLVQLVEGEGAQASLPEVEIQDWPALAFRGVMVDMSHGPLPTEDEVKRQLDFLARWKLNQYYLYSEASTELAGYPLLNPTGRFSQDELRRIIAYGRERHIDVIPCLELFGHLHDLFRVEKYSEMADVPHGTEFDPRNPKAAALLNDWIDQLARLFPSPFVHIGFDETFQIEMASKESGAGANPADLFLRQLNQVAGELQRNGKTVMMWGDIIVKYPAVIPQLPQKLIAVAWDYDPGTIEKFWHWLGPLSDHHVPHVIATGVWGWNQVSPNFTMSFENIDQFLAAGRKSGALGMMNTIWTDDAQALVRQTWPGMAYGAAAAWQTQPMDRAGFFSQYSRLMYPAKVAADVARALEDLDGSERALEKLLENESMIAMWRNPFDPVLMQKEKAHLNDLSQARLLAEDAEERLDRALAAGGDPITLSSLRFGGRLLDYAAQKFQTVPELEEMWTKLGPKHPAGQLWWNNWSSMVIYPDHSRLADLEDSITELRGQYRAEWMAEYVPYRLESALGRWDMEYQFWMSMQAHLLDFSESSHDGDPLPKLETFAPRN